MFGWGFLTNVFAYLAVLVGPSELSESTLDPSKFVVSDHYSFVKLVVPLWHEHYQWTLAGENDSWTSYFVNFSLPSKMSRQTTLAVFRAGGKPKTKCVYFNGALASEATPSVNNLVMKTVRSSGTEFNTSVWFVDQPNEPFFALVQCNTGYWPSWVGYNTSDPWCKSWRVALYFNGTEKHSEQEYADIEKALQQRIGFEFRALTKAFMAPSADCSNHTTSITKTTTLTTNSGMISALDTIIYLSAVSLLILT